MKKTLLILTVFLYLVVGVSPEAGAQVKNLFNFADSNGAYSSGSLILSGNVLYGQASNGGVNDLGDIFSINTDGSGFKDIWDFADTGSAGNANGAEPGSSLTLIGNKLYGVTRYGGANDYGNIYRINTDGSGYKDLWDFDDTGLNGNANGAGSECKLLLAGNKLYGMTSDGGSNEEGNIFSIDTDGSGYKDIWDFADTGSTGNANGEIPYGSLIISGKVLYGVTNGGGANGVGVIFAIDTDGAHYKDMLDFNGDNGEYSITSLTLSGTVLYGVANAGGDGYGDGVIFSINSDGTHFKDLLDFNFANGAGPQGELTVSGNLLYGMTYAGGAYGHGPKRGAVTGGVIFSIDTNGSGYSDILDFNTTDGANPAGGLVLSGGTLYGMTSDGGAYGFGNVFSDDICNLLTATGSTRGTEDTGACTGIATVALSGGPSPFTYLWSGGQTTDSITGQCTGTYSCTVTDNNGCTTNASATVNIATGVSNVTANAAQISVYPNPNKGEFTVQWSVVSGQSLVVEIYNMLGQEVYTPTLLPQSGGGVSSAFQINLSSQPNGVYLYRIITESGNLEGQGKLIIEK